ncbi:MAG: M23 family metallopeptidase [Pseudomonadota bacterium]
MKKFLYNIQRVIRTKKTVFLFMFLGVGFFTGMILFFSYSFDKAESSHVLPSDNKIKKIKHILVRDNTIYDVLSEDKITPQEIFNLMCASKKVYNLSRIRPGNTLDLEMNVIDNTINCLRYEIDEGNILIVERSNNDFSARKEKIKYETRLSAKAGVIHDSLFETIVEIGLSPQVAMDLADIFAWDIDFNTDIREGDEFKIIFEQKYRDGGFVKNGKILCAEFINQEEVFSAVFFKNRVGHSDYYDQEGKSLRKKFLKSPLRYSYISSRYAKRRFHPILKIYRPHLGIDYAAPKGTPVVALGDGKVIFAGRKGGYGKFVKIKHNGTFTTMYGHLCRFAKGIKHNKLVKQGAIIGYVGATGLATGPHLDFRLVKNGRFINPLAFNPPSAGPVKKEYIEEFETVKNEMFSWLDQLAPATADKRFAEN